MSIHVYYQPIDVNTVHEVIIPYILGTVSVDRLLAGCPCSDPDVALAILSPLRDANAMRPSGKDYRHPELGRCDPTEFLVEESIRAVLHFTREVWPSHSANAYTTIDLLGDFPVLEHFQMPVALFRPLVNEFPQLASRLETIPDAEVMGGVVPRDHVRYVRQAIESQLARLSRDPNDPHWYDAMAELKAALAYAEQNGLAFTEAIE